MFEGLTYVRRMLGTLLGNRMEGRNGGIVFDK